MLSIIILGFSFLAFCLPLGFKMEKTFIDKVFGTFQIGLMKIDFRLSFFSKQICSNQSGIILRAEGKLEREKEMRDFFKNNRTVLSNLVKCEN